MGQPSASGFRPWRQGSGHGGRVQASAAGFRVQARSAKAGSTAEKRPAAEAGTQSPRVLPGCERRTRVHLRSRIDDLRAKESRGERIRAEESGGEQEQRRAEQSRWRMITGGGLPSSGGAGSTRV